MHFVLNFSDCIYFLVLLPFIHFLSTVVDLSWGSVGALRSPLSSSVMIVRHRVVVRHAAVVSHSHSGCSLGELLMSLSVG